MKTLSLDGEWRFKAVGESEWMSAEVPGTVHTDLMANGRIPDPFYRMNENDVQWVAEESWVYSREFTVPPALLAEDAVDLVVEGLDTYAKIRVNGVKVAETSNMFIGHRVALKEYLRAGTNVLDIIFDSPTRRSKSLESTYGKLRVALEPHRVYVRKAQYSFSWDWGPRLTTSGIWRPLRIEAYSSARLANPHVKILSVNPKRALVELSADVVRVGPGDLTVSTFVGGEQSVAEHDAHISGGTARVRLTIEKPALWWPNGYGDQPMYTALFMLRRDGEDIHQLHVPFALRTVDLLQEKDSQGRSFILRINGKKIFCKGADWIPSDNFLPRIPAEKYKTLLMMARNASMNMIRVWGGGIYEQDVFYELCDRLGLMVWQDFMYACGEYPSHPAFVREARAEAEAVVKRLRNHPSLVLWCGNNECEWLYCTENPTKGPDDMHGAVIFRDVLASTVQTLDGTRPYWRSSPFGTGFPNDESNGNHHQWTVWSAWRDYKEYELDSARFVTEFGFQAPAHRKTYEEVTLPSDRWPQSKVMEHHNKQIEGQERLFRFQAAHYKVGHTLEEFIYRGQLVQAEALKVAAEHWRRRKFRTAGVLFWQLNDCWPVSSWAVIDSALRPKAAYYYARKFFAPVLVSFKRVGEDLELWATNDLMEGIKGVATVSLITFKGKVLDKTAYRLRLSPNSSGKVATIKTSEYGMIDKTGCYLCVKLLGAGQPLAENRFFFEEPKHLVLPEPRINHTIRQRKDGFYAIVLTSARFVKNLCLELDGEPGPFSDNFFDLDPGARKEVVVCTLMTLAEVKRKLKVKWLD